MGRVDFLILPDDQPHSLQQYACRLAQQHWSTGERVLIQTDNESQSQQLDELLWNLGAESFIPHAVATLEAIDQQQPVLISHQKITDTNFQYIINLSCRPSDILSDSGAVKIDELLNQDEQRKQCGRKNYKAYRELGYTLKHHTLESVNG